MKKEKIAYYANRIASHADAPWVTPVFFLLFFLDSFLVFIPCDSLLGATAAIRPRHVKKWCIAAILGVIAGLALVVVAAYTFLHGYLYTWTQAEGFYSQVGDILAHAQQYGYVELTIGVFTFIPCVIGAIAAAMIGMNPWAVYGIVVAAKIMRIILAVWILHHGGSLLKRAAKVYLKIPG
jgi:membrane protein YqaA with SNARE-associated domain